MRRYPLPWLDGLRPDTRAYYGVTGDSIQRPFSCRSSSPQDPQVQREVLVTLPTKDTASVHLVAYRMPR
ncbi:hypothetical protein FRACA_2560004 [Frankia canadensis]|uniref:Uncharacterized protein n=1 Tax=Frankia canadensis TaxID=1836972 RepID=A0A2I2KSA6_9ACTN|nr:hypothetical protein [Frankia canadensis]SNQ48529.1 hypothetical protein FRACA_2560004 [Frankia canadensis]SOU55819.1 hypothetical protein FRACA_2560004 [Frankia canadensis]